MNHPQGVILLRAGSLKMGYPHNTLRLSAFACNQFEVAVELCSPEAVVSLGRFGGEFEAAAGNIRDRLPVRGAHIAG
jgi:hypothetical protein